MSLSLDHVGGPDAELPKVTDEPCCMGAAVYGHQRCTCWREVYDQEQQPPIEGGERVVRDRCCGDCAFRMDSPERSGDTRYKHSSEDGVADLVHGRGTFMCHVGMRKIVALRHEVTGDEIPMQIDAYAPLIIDGVAYKADGTRAEVCAGQIAMRKGLNAGGGDG